MGNYSLVIQKGITEIAWQTLCRIFRMPGFRMLVPRSRHSILVTFDSYEEAMDALDRLNT